MRVVVGMSGGVDSSVAAFLLKQQGHDVIGVFMKNWDDEDDEFCTAEEDYDDVRKTCDTIGIPYYTVNFSLQYRQRVFDTFLREYSAGRTPNPDVLCNSEIKFNAFLDYALGAEADALATGHYARLHKDDSGVHLLRGKDENKDQTYFLCALNQQQLGRAMFPIGEMEKFEVREIAQKAGLPTADKKDSTGICFIGERKFAEFIAQHIPSLPGDMVDIDTGKAMARHEGLSRYTVGQRKGIGIGGGGNGAPWFVARKDAANNILYIAQGKEHPSLYYTGLDTAGFEWIAGERPADEFHCTVKFRYRQKDIPARAFCQNGDVHIAFEGKHRAVAPGQYAVLYNKEECLGGGIIRTGIQE